LHRRLTHCKLRVSCGSTISDIVVWVYSPRKFRVNFGCKLAAMSLETCNELIRTISDRLGEIVPRVSVHPGRDGLLRIVVMRRRINEQPQTITVDTNFLEDWENGIDAEGRKHPSSRDIETQLVMAIMMADSMPQSEARTSWAISDLLSRIP
jgi:hypothetical protein